MVLEDVFVHVKDNPSLSEDCQGGETVSYDAEWDDRKGKMKGISAGWDYGRILHFSLWG